MFQAIPAEPLAWAGAFAMSPPKHVNVNEVFFPAHEAGTVRRVRKASVELNLLFAVQAQPRAEDAMEWDGGWVRS